MLAASEMPHERPSVVCIASSFPGVPALTVDAMAGAVALTLTLTKRWLRDLQTLTQTPDRAVLLFSSVVGKAYLWITYSEIHK